MTTIADLQALSGIPVVESRGANVTISLDPQELQRIQEMISALAEKDGAQLDDLWSEAVTRVIGTELKALLLNGELIHSLWSSGKLRRLTNDVPF